MQYVPTSDPDVEGRADDTTESMLLVGGDHCGNLSPELRAGGLFRQVVKHSSPDEFTRSSSSQFLAFQWMMNDDPWALCPSDDEKDIHQRYVLAVLYFSMYGDLWPSCNRADASFNTPCESDFRRYLSGANVCDWSGNTCNEDGYVTEISVGE